MVDSVCLRSAPRSADARGASFPWPSDPAGRVEIHPADLRGEERSSLGKKAAVIAETQMHSAGPKAALPVADDCESRVPIDSVADIGYRLSPKRIRIPPIRNPLCGFLSKGRVPLAAVTAIIS